MYYFSYNTLGLTLGLTANLCLVSGKLWYLRHRIKCTEVLSMKYSKDFDDSRRKNVDYIVARW